MRLASTKKATQERAATAYLFTERRQPENGNYLAVPRTSSERREFIPIAYKKSSVIAANDLQIIPNAEIPEFAMLNSRFHNTWARVTAGRLKSDIRYSAKFTYNTFPWPDLTDAAKATLTKTGQAILDARAAWPEATLADLYDPDSMPANLRKAHIANDKAVDKLYRKKPFESERERVEHLFMLYEQLQAPLVAASKPKPRKRKARTVKTS